MALAFSPEHIETTQAPDLRIVDVPEIIEVADPVSHVEPWFPPGLARRLVLGAVGMMLFTLAVIAVPLWLSTGSAAYAFGVAALPAFWCGGGFGAIMGAASYSAAQEH